MSKVLHGTKQDINVPDMFWEIMPERTIAIVNAAKDMPLPTVLNISDYIINGADISADLQVLRQTEDTKENLQPYLDDINNNVCWIWGDIENGGLASWYAGNGIVKFCLFQGYFINESTGAYRWSIGATESKEYVKLSEFIMFDRGDNGIRLYCYYAEDASGWGIKTARVDDDESWPTSDPDVYRRIRYYVNPDVKTFDNLGSGIYVELSPAYPLPISTSYWPYVGMVDDGSTGAIDFTLNSTEMEGYTHYGDIFYSASEDPNSYGGTSTTGGGNGDFNNNSDPVDFSHPEDFTTTGINNGFLTIYNPTEAQIKSFNDFLFVDITDTLSTQLKRLISDPLDYVVSLSLIHLGPVCSTSGEIKFCGISSGVTAPIVDKRYVELDCGSINIVERFKSALDYAQYTKCKIYLPYCGIYPLSIDDIMGGNLYLKYNIDLLTGACSAQLKCRRSKRNGLGNGDANNLNSVLYEFTGTCISSLPLSATDWRGFFQGACQIAASAGSLATGNPVGAAAGIAGSVASMKPDIQKSGNLSIDYGFMGIQIPYIIMERPIQSLPQKFGERKGYPSNVYESLSDCKGYVKITDNDLWTGGIHGTNAEMEELKALFNEGVWIESWN